ncbi:MAG: BNR repeat-containing protein [Balneolaceae bacterium]
MKQLKTDLLIIAAFLAVLAACNPDERLSEEPVVRIVPVDTGWAQSSINAVIFRQNSIISRDSLQFTGYYDEEGTVVLARREIENTEWDVIPTRFEGDVRDAHNNISLGLDGDGYLHMVWGLHGFPIRYVQSLEPWSLELTDPLEMTGESESAVTYPQFYTLEDGDLLFVYREGGSGNGNVMMNRFHTETRKWVPLHHPLIDGEGERNAYINPVAIDGEGGWHISWNWRNTPDVATNHNLSYAYSPDEGESWYDSSGESYELPITYENSEIVREIPQNRELINQTSMTTDSGGNPFIVTYWRPEGSETPQFHLVWQNRETGIWNTSQVGDRQTPFSLSGMHTRRIPISRPLVVAGPDDCIYVVFRDFERGGGISLASAEPPDYIEWSITELDTASVGLWEPTYDPAAWRNHTQLHLFRQRVGQGDGETLEDIPPQEISILEWIP